MPARSMILNGNQMRKAREALKALPPEQREELHYQGIGPGDSYVGMWRMVNRYRYRLNSLDQEMRADMTTSKWSELEKHARYMPSRSPPSTGSCWSMRSQSWRRWNSRAISRSRCTRKSTCGTCQTKISMRSRESFPSSVARLDPAGLRGVTPIQEIRR